MTRLNAFTDDALGDLEAVGLTEEIQSGRISATDAVEAAIARLERVAPELNGLAHAAFDRARADAADARGGYFCGVPALVKDNAELAGVPTQQERKRVVSGKSVSVRVELGGSSILKKNKKNKPTHRH